MLKIVTTCVFLSASLLAQEPQLDWVRRVEPTYPQMALIAHTKARY